jgi:hypothetical protein
MALDPAATSAVWGEGMGSGDAGAGAEPGVSIRRTSPVWALGEARPTGAWRPARPGGTRRGLLRARPGCAGTAGRRRANPATARTSRGPLAEFGAGALLTTPARARAALWLGVARGPGGGGHGGQRRLAPEAAGAGPAPCAAPEGASAGGAPSASGANSVWPSPARGARRPLSSLAAAPVGDGGWAAPVGDGGWGRLGFETLAAPI